MKTLILYIICLLPSLGFSQKSLSDLLKKYNTENISYVLAQDVQNTSSNIIFLDARELEEYNVSHLKNAIYVGYNNFKLEDVETQIPDKNQNIIVYCSLGIRSEVIAQKLSDAGYTNVQNLYGGIFEWKNNNFKIYNKNQIETDSIHAFSKAWSKWLEKGIKVYE